jgi:thiamine-monophosphate kinase
MGGRPTAAVVGLGAPAGFQVKRLEALFRAIEQACRRWGMDLVGGDTVRSERFVLAVAVLGTFGAPAERLPLRSRVQPGQNLYVTGMLGDSAAGLTVLLASSDSPECNLPAAVRRTLVDRHRRPAPRLEEGHRLVGAFDDLAMIDLSDDLLKSLDLLREASGAGAAIRLDRLPLSAALRRFARAAGCDPVEMAVCGGEDFELLFATAANLRAVRKVFRDGGIQTPVRLIGRVGGKRLRWLDRRGREVAPRWSGYEQFT